MNRASSFDVDGRDSQGQPRLARPILVTDQDEREFQIAMEDYKRQSGRLFPTWSEILEVLRSLGYKKRIWPSVESWAAIPPGVIEGEAKLGVIGWFSHVETSVTP